MKTTKRFCLKCEKIRNFIYNRNINHSECEYCCGRFAVNPNSIMYKYFINKINQLNSEIKNKLSENDFEYKIKLEEKISLKNKKIDKLYTKTKNQSKLITKLEEKKTIYKKEAIKKLESIKPIETTTTTIQGEPYTFKKYSKEQILLLLDCIYGE